MGYSDKYRILLFTPYGRQPNEIFWKLAEEYPEAKFFYYLDMKNECSNLMNKFGYIPLLRPWTLREHFKAYKELENDAIFYLDSDVIFTKHLDLDQYLNDDICYLSYTGNADRSDNYISARYFDSKTKDVDPKKLEAYSRRDILAETAQLVGISRETCVTNEPHTGGAQYLLKGINSKFWADVLDGCMMIKTHLQNVNQRFFPGATAQDKENRGFQSWCADMWAVLWNVWKRGYETRTPPELDFAWSSSGIENWDKVYLYHDAGATGEPFYVDGEAHWLFYKRGQRIEISPNNYAYLRNYTDNQRSPYDDDLSWVSPKFCSYNYVQAINESNLVTQNTQIV